MKVAPWNYTSFTQPDAMLIVSFPMNMTFPVYSHPPQLYLEAGGAPNSCLTILDYGAVKALIVSI
jgi:hypothetical protein